MRIEWHIADKEQKLQMFPACGPLEFVAIHNTGPLRDTVKGNQYVIVILDRFSKLTWSMRTGKIFLLHVANVLFGSW